MGGQTTRLSQRWALLGIILLAFLLRVYSLGRGELWFDEALSAVIAAKGRLDIVRYTLSTPFEHPPLYYLLLHDWVRGAGASEFALRFFSLFWGVLLVPLLYRLAIPLGGASLGVLAALVCALSAVHIDHSQNTRMYSVLPVLGVVLLLLFFRALKTQRLRWWIASLVVAALGIAVHYYFALMLLVPLAFLVLSGRAYRKQVVLFLLGLILCALLLASWFGLSTGAMDALEQVAAGEGPSVSSLDQRILYTAGGLLSEPPMVGHVALGILAVLGAIFWPLPPAPTTHPVGRVGSRRFVLVWLFVPWLVALLIPYWLQDRHLSYLLPAIYLLLAAGLLVLRSRGLLLFLAGLLLLGATAGFWLFRQEEEPIFEFGAIMAHIEDRALPDDLIIMNQPAFWPFEEHYAKGVAPTAYVAAPPGLPDAMLDTNLRSVVSGHGRVWLGPVGAWTEDPESRVEQWLVSHAYQAYKEWFEAGGSAALYFTTNALQPLTIEPAPVWEGGIRLVAVHSSAPRLAAGDALRIALSWQTAESQTERRLVALYLVDAEGRTWATRRSEPCSGWCPVESWEPAAVVQDQHALLIPEGTPSGIYRLQLALIDPDLDRELAATGSGQRVDLGPVEVLNPVQTTAVPPTGPVVQYPLEADLGAEIALLGFDLVSKRVPVGGTVGLDLYWQVKDTPADDYDLLLELVSPDGEVLANWYRSLVADTFPTSDWRKGQHLRGPHQLSLPRQVGPGVYDLRLSLLDAQGQPLSTRATARGTGLDRWLPWLPRGTEDSLLLLSGLQVAQRPDRVHNFELPDMTNSLRFRLGQRVDLLGYDLDLSSATPGGQLDLTLYWQALGPTVKPYKVFTHLGQDGQIPVAQHDGLPGEGCCPPNTWVEGEVIVDRHLLPLPLDLYPRAYLLSVGMYDESNGLRLPVLNAQGREVEGDRVPITQVLIRPGGIPVPPPILPDMDYRLYLPLMEANQ